MSIIIGHFKHITCNYNAEFHIQHRLVTVFLIILDKFPTRISSLNHSLIFLLPQRFRYSYHDYQSELKNVGNIKIIVSTSSVQITIVLVFVMIDTTLSFTFSTHTCTALL